MYVQALRAAAQDGVDVRLLVPSATDIPVVAALSRANYRALLEAGVRVFEWNGPMIHAKTSVVDGRWARVGSTNLNVASWMGNWELDVTIEDAGFAKQMQEMYCRDLEHATEIVISDRQRVKPIGPPHPRVGRRQRTSRKGSTSRAAAGVIGVGSAVGAAITNRRVLGPAEARLMALAGGVLLGLSVVAVKWPRGITYPLAFLGTWVAIALFIRAYKLRKGARLPHEGEMCEPPPAAGGKKFRTGGELKEMRLGGVRESSNVEDRRGGGMGGGKMAVGGGCGTLIIIILALVFGVDPRQLLDSGVVPQEGPPPQQQQTGPQQQEQTDAESQFIGKVLGTTEDVWHDIFQRNGSQYREPTLRLFTRADGLGLREGGRFGRPLLLSGRREASISTSPSTTSCSQRFRAPGDFAQAYVIAHEVGHHVQNLLGTSDKVTQLQQRARSEAQANDLSVRLELQADCYAGVWGFYAKQRDILDPDDLEEALRRRLGHRRRPPPARGARATPSPTPSPTALPSSACAGSARASTPATSAAATPSAPAVVKRENRVSEGIDGASLHVLG